MRFVNLRLEYTNYFIKLKYVVPVKKCRTKFNEIPVKLTKK